MPTSKMIAEDGRAVWEELKGRGGLDLRRGQGAYDGYDVPMERELNGLLFPGFFNSLDDNFRAHPITSEAFLVAFFQTQRPFSMMMDDVLGFFERASARYGQDNLKIVFNFEKGKELAIDLSHFREWQKFLQTVTAEQKSWQWSPDGLWQLTYSLNNLLEVSYPSELPDPVDPAVRYWVDRSRYADWRDPPRLPYSGNEVFDRIVQRCQRLLDAYHAACRSIAPDREAFMEVGRRAMRDRGGPDAATAKHADDIFALWQPETDLWAKTFTKAITVVAEQVANGASIPSPGFIENYSAMLDAMDAGSTTVDELREAFRELLNLPIWKRRHELYAVWVGSRIAAALDDLHATYHTEDAVLRFPFSGAHLATFIDMETQILMFWTELRSRLRSKSLIGRKNIQPDYRIVKLPFEPEQNSMVIVECKQYRQSALGEFSNALNDYARGCPNATVILVNNGPISGRLQSRIDAEHSHRTHAIAEFRPDNPDQLNLFRSLVRTAALGPTGVDLATEQNGEDHAPAIRLAWSAQFVDLDLVVRFTPVGEPSGKHIVSFADRGSPDTWPGLFLEQDVQSGPGEEVVRSTGWKAGSYDIFVHNYSDDRSPASAGVWVTVHHPRSPRPIRIDGGSVANAEGRFWHVGSIDGLTGVLRMVGRTGDEDIIGA